MRDFETTPAGPRLAGEKLDAWKNELGPDTLPLIGEQLVALAVRFQRLRLPKAMLQMIELAAIALGSKAVQARLEASGIDKSVAQRMVLQPQAPMPHDGSTSGSRSGVNLRQQPAPQKRR